MRCSDASIVGLFSAFLLLDQSPQAVVAFAPTRGPATSLYSIPLPLPLPLSLRLPLRSPSPSPSSTSLHDGRGDFMGDGFRRFWGEVTGGVEEKVANEELGQMEESLGARLRERQYEFSSASQYGRPRYDDQEYSRRRYSGRESSTTSEEYSRPQRNSLMDDQGAAMMRMAGETRYHSPGMRSGEAMRWAQQQAQSQSQAQSQAQAQSRRRNGYERFDSHDGRDNTYGGSRDRADFFGDGDADRNPTNRRDYDRRSNDDWSRQDGGRSSYARGARFSDGRRDSDQGRYDHRDFLFSGRRNDARYRHDSTGRYPSSPRQWDNQRSRDDKWNYRYNGGREDDRYRYSDRDSRAVRPWGDDASRYDGRNNPGRFDGKAGYDRGREDDRFGYTSKRYQYDQRRGDNVSRYDRRGREDDAGSFYLDENDRRRRDPEDELERVRSIYKRWCEFYGKTFEEYRFDVFADNLHSAERLGESRGGRIQLNGSADITSVEYSRQGGGLARY